MDGNGGNNSNEAQPLLIGAVPPGGGVSKLPLHGRDTGIEGWEQQCRRRTARGGAAGDVIVVNRAVEHLPRPHLHACIPWPRRRQMRYHPHITHPRWIR